MATGDFIEGGPWPAIVAGFRSGTTEREAYVSADLTFWDSTTGDHVLGPIRGSWVDHHYNCARLTPGRTHDLIVAFVNGGLVMTADDRRERGSSYGQLAMAELRGGSLLASVVLATDAAIDGAAHYNFEWTVSSGFVIKLGT